MTEIIAAVLGACIASSWAWFLQNQLARKQEKFQRELWDEQKAFQKSLLNQQQKFEEETRAGSMQFWLNRQADIKHFLDEQAMERRNFEKTGIHSMRKLGGG
jgi:hypothetical protein